MPQAGSTRLSVATLVALAGAFALTIGALPQAAQAAAPVPSPGPLTVVGLTLLASPDASVQIPLTALTAAPASAGTLMASVTTTPTLGVATVEPGGSGEAASIRYQAPRTVPAALLGDANSGAPASSAPIEFGYRLCRAGSGTSTGTDCVNGTVRIVFQTPVMLLAEPGQTVQLRTAELGSRLESALTTLTPPATPANATALTTLTATTAAGTTRVDVHGIEFTAPATPGHTVLSWRGCTASGSCVFGVIDAHTVAPLTASRSILTSAISQRGTALLPVPTDLGDNVPDLTSLRVLGQPRFTPSERGIDVGRLTTTTQGGNILVSGLPGTTSGVLTLSYRLCSSVNPADCTVNALTATLTPVLTAVVDASATASTNSQRAEPDAQTGTRSTPATTAPTTKDAAAAGADAARVAGSTDLTWWVIGGALLFMLGGGATVVGARKS